MKRVVCIIVSFVILSLGHDLSIAQTKQASPNEYAVVVNRALAQDSEWMNVINELKEKHHAEVVIFEEHPEEVAEQLKMIFPRYVALVEKPEKITREYVQRMHKLSRGMDDDVFQDFLWGIVTGYDAEGALQLIRNAEKPLTVKTAMSIGAKIEKYSCFERSVYIDDFFWGKLIKDEYGREKAGTFYSTWTDRQRENTIKIDTVPFEDVSCKFAEKYRNLNPGFIVSTSNFQNGDLRFCYHYLRGSEGRLYVGFEKQREKDIRLSDLKACRVFLGMGSYSGAMSEAADVILACLKDGDVSGWAGYVYSRWHGQAAWGTWKLWMANPGRFSFSEAVYLNQQFILSSLRDNTPKLVEIDYPLTENVTKDYLEQKEQVMREIGQGISLDQMGYLNERDIFVYYGDPKWEAKLDGKPEDVHYTVNTVKKGKRYIITVRTDEHYKRQEMEGARFQEDPGMFNKQIVGRLPFIYFFPKRLKNPRLAKELDFDGDIELDENFIFIYRTYWEPDQTYTIVLSTDKD
ncbi:hypothetical protein [Sanguibacteroides justesenii]|uniref:Uncharacterized protein n=1 Tax=Sanguibacteroides justesenii TaxID=1547597 RepID=A0A0C3R727_9PORP|nr:hypothetical protein [Sanguibacteroides justesenii]KIO43741.1 hypothetical protein IE90_11555 [Sanguibacteroides justesenii]KIO45905.1 hypothetical protein BA92_05520 [Sanguibacteroides justesenii]PXZ45015.1 hypothetical protein DMB45_00790 [Sanguibacteroides justesenii]